MKATTGPRTHRGEREVVLIVERPDRRVVAVETKLAATVSEADVKHLVLSLRDGSGTASSTSSCDEWPLVGREVERSRLSRR